MTIRRSAAAVGAVAVGLLALSACSKPTPLATVTAGSSSVQSEAVCYNDGKPLSQNDLKSCLAKTPSETIKVKSTDKLHVGVDPAIADKGWALLTGSVQRTNVLTRQTYYSLPDAGALFTDNQTGQRSKSVELAVVEVAPGGGTTGLWKVKLELTD
ncbi:MULTISPECIES: hypothetical protein [Streptomycetaceae]|uniref:Putative lipoprotein n=1 Tax=Streptantibioticus cattleyicolor (strain ATCC 35852 / DSM 46488 / JCM 4925 / NBRC 14057 / NRRL 8057) TaxID=1003195 RepID=G8WS17_STREN|nr:MULTISPECIES: hypothetical protein [Streptomycetaceae]AEW94777.1 putative lipoprotein [Streptantibioticus cattleyicolor NRRL 8057 = DSM 46488]MYS59402.1 hypothetical protein [Streptomyces sp. SID5468]